MAEKLKMDLRINGYDDENRCIYYSESGRCLIFLPNHETIEDIYKTINHFCDNLSCVCGKCIKIQNFFLNRQ